MHSVLSFYGFIEPNMSLEQHIKTHKMVKCYELASCKRAFKAGNKSAMLILYTLALETTRNELF